MREDELVDAFVAGLIEARDGVELEQDRHGIDEWRELELQAALAAGARAAGFFVAREQRYPGDRTERRRTSGRRCDLVVTFDGPLLEEHGQPDLFAPTPSGVQDATWIEVKVARQFGPHGARHGWDHSLLEPPTIDLLRLGGDAALRTGALALLLFTADEQVAVHDVTTWRDVVLRAGLSVAPVTLRHVPIVDRVGNACCTLAWLPMSSPSRL